jgi:hemin uptake protein HemP
MAGPLRVTAGELDAEALLTAIDEGRRVVVETEMLGGTHEVTLRSDGSTYYCDTPTTLHRHEDREGMRRCLTDQGYVSDDQ